MSSKSTELNKPFAKEDLAAAKAIVAQYEIIVASADGQWYGKGLEMPTVFADGKTPNECIKNTTEALVATVAHLLEKGEPVPAAASSGKRTEQVNVRLTSQEKAILVAAARAQGFRGLGDYIRSKAITH